MKRLTFITSICLIAALLLSLVLSSCAPTSAPAPTQPTQPAYTPGVTQPAPTRVTPTTPQATKPAAAPAAEVVKWRMQTFVPEPDLAWPEGALFLTDNIKEMSGGRFDIKPFVEAAIIPTEDILAAVKDGVIEIGYSAPGYYAGIIPEADLENILPLTLRGAHDLAILYWGRGFEDIVREAYTEYGVHLLVVGPASVIGMWTTKPIRSLEDLQGMKIRSFGRFLDLLNEFGAAATYIPLGEVYMALQLGTLDGASTDPPSYEMVKHYEVAKYFTHPLLGFTSNHFTVNQDKWDTLPDDLKAMLSEVGRSSLLNYDWNLKRVEWEMYGKFSQWGSELITLPASDQKKLATAALTFVDDAGSKNARCGQLADMLKDFMRMRGYID